MPHSYMTANLDGKRSRSQLEVILGAGADVVLATEVPDGLEIEGYDCLARSPVPMTESKAFSAIYSKVGGRELESPHGASAMAEIEGVVVLCSVLPWRSAKGAPWVGEGQRERFVNALRAIRQAAMRPQVWGGDWNQEMVTEAALYVGCEEGRQGIDALLSDWRMVLPTRSLEAKLGGPTIDHVAIGGDLRLQSAEPVGGLSAREHHAYVVRVEAEARATKTS